MNWVTSLFHITSTLMTVLRALTRQSVRKELEAEIRENLDSKAFAKSATAIEARLRERNRHNNSDRLRTTDPFERL